MSFAAVADYSNDKSVDLFRHGYEDHDSEFFDQFLTFSPVNSASDDVAGLLDAYTTKSSSSNSNVVDTPANIHNNNTTHSSNHQHRRHSSWSTKHVTAPSQNNGAQNNGFYTESSGRAAVSDSELLTLEGISLNSPQMPSFSQSSLPATPSPSATTPSRRKSRLVKSMSKAFKGVTENFQNSYRSPTRKTNSLSRATHRLNHRRSNLGHWEKKLPNDTLGFELKSETNIATLPFDHTTATPLVTEESQGRFAYNSIPQRNTTTSTTHDTPQATPELCSRHSRKTSDTYLPITPQLHSSTAFWPQTPALSDHSNFEGSSIYNPPDMKIPVCWDDASAPLMAQPLPIGFHTNPQLATKNLTHLLQSDLAYDNDHPLNPMNMSSGLMIQIAQAPTQRPLVGEHVPRMSQQGHQVTTTLQQPVHFRQKTAQVLPKQPHKSSPCEMRPEHSSDSEPSSPKPSSFKARKRRSPKTGRTSWSRAQQRPKSGGGVGFVNLTPDDSRKILTGVAPSGSSKTKARRDKEAMDKRRKLSQAALRAVKAVGGDVDSLVEQGLFV